MLIDIFGELVYNGIMKGKEGPMVMPVDRFMRRRAGARYKHDDEIVSCSYMKRLPRAISDEDMDLYFEVEWGGDDGQALSGE